MTTRQKVTKTQAVLTYLEKHPDASSKEIVAALARRSITITADYVTRIKGKAGGKKTKPAAKAASAKKPPKKSRAKTSKPVAADPPAPEAEAVAEPAAEPAPAAKPVAKSAAKPSEAKVDGYLSAFDKSQRLQAFIGVEQHLGAPISDTQYWRYLGRAYQDTQCLFPHRALLGILFGSARPEREYIMDAQERKALAALPDEFTVYRGHIGRNSRGWSWTLDANQAKRFAKELPAGVTGVHPKITSGTVRKADVVALFLARGEQEIVVNPDRVRKAKVFDVAVE